MGAENIFPCGLRIYFGYEISLDSLMGFLILDHCGFRWNRDRWLHPEDMKSWRKLVKLVKIFYDYRESRHRSKSKEDSHWCHLATKERQNRKTGSQLSNEQERTSSVNSNPQMRRWNSSKRKRQREKQWLSKSKHVQEVSSWRGITLSVSWFKPQWRARYQTYEKTDTWNDDQNRKTTREKCRAH